MKFKILLIDDNPDALKLYKRNLEDHDYQVITASNDIEAYYLLETQIPDLIVLDISFGDNDRLGITILKWIRDKLGEAVPVIMLTGVKQDELEPLSFNLGASDFAWKTISIDGLLARVHTRLGRSQIPIIIDDYLRVDLNNAAMSVKRDEEWQLIPLHPREWDVFKKLFLHPGRIIPRENFLENIFADADNSERALNICISRLRSLIEPNPPDWQYILTRYGVGYSFREYRVRR